MRCQENNNNSKIELVRQYVHQGPLYNVNLLVDTVDTSAKRKHTLSRFDCRTKNGCSRLPSASVWNWAWQKTSSNSPKVQLISGLTFFPPHQAHRKNWFWNRCQGFLYSNFCSERVSVTHWLKQGIWNWIFSIIGCHEVHHPGNLRGHQEKGDLPIDPSPLWSSGPSGQRPWKQWGFQNLSSGLAMSPHYVGFMHTLGLKLNSVDILLSNLFGG